MLHREAVVWKRLSHPNIVPFKGVTLYPLQIVSEWMPGGDLTCYISVNPQANRINLVSTVFVFPETQPYFSVSWLVSQRGFTTSTFAAWSMETSREWVLRYR
jgi:serine/threonine protein kinase